MRHRDAAKTRGLGRYDPGDGVLDDDGAERGARTALARELLDGEEIAFRIGLARDASLGGHDERDARGDVHLLEAKSDLVLERTGNDGDGAQRSAPAHELRGAGKDSQRGRDALHVAGLLGEDESAHFGIAARAAVVGEDRPKRADVVEAEVALEIGRIGDRDPERAHDVTKRLEVHRLVVDEHTVEVEERRAHARRGSATCRLSPARSRR